MLTLYLRPLDKFDQDNAWYYTKAIGHNISKMMLNTLTFWHINTKISYLYYVVTLTLLYLLVLVALQTVLVFLSYKENGSITSRPSSREISH